MQADERISVSVDEESTDQNNLDELGTEDNSVTSIETTNIYHNRPSFTGLKRFCDTRWSCIFQLTECHIKHYGIFFINFRHCAHF